MSLKVVGIKNPILRQKARPVLGVDKKTRELIRQMRETLASQKDPEGVGLAAPQVGKNLQIFLASHNGIEKVIINPKVIKISRAKARGSKKTKRRILEGCLSLPHFYGPIKRAPKIKLAYLDEEGDKKVEEFKGFMAQIVQHELDHLEGILFIDRVLEQKAPLYKYSKDGWEEVELI